MQRILRYRRWGAAALVLALVVACGDDETGSPASGEAGAPDTTADSTAAPATTDGGRPDGTSSSGGSVTAADLDGREFVSQTVDGYDLAPGSSIRVAFEGQELALSAGCNSMFGTYAIEEDVLTVPAMAMTEMACEEPLMTQDTWIADLLTAGVTVTLDGDELVFTDGDAVTITFLDREVAEPDASIEGTRWVVDGLIDGDGVSSVPADAEASLTIVDGTAEIETGCNTGSGSVEVGPETLTFGPLALTLRACDPAATELETAVLATLSGEVDYAIEADRLLLTRAVEDGEIGLTLVAG